MKCGVKILIQCQALLLFYDCMHITFKKLVSNINKLEKCVISSWYECRWLNGTWLHSLILTFWNYISYFNSYIDLTSTSNNSRKKYLVQILYQILLKAVLYIKNIYVCITKMRISDFISNIPWIVLNVNKMISSGHVLNFCT